MRLPTHGDDHRMGTWSFADGSNELHPVVERHVEIGEQDVHFFPVQAPERIANVGSIEYAEPARLEHEAAEEPNVGDVDYDKDGQARGRLFRHSQPISRSFKAT